MVTCVTLLAKRNWLLGEHFGGESTCFIHSAPGRITISPRDLQQPDGAAPEKATCTREESTLTSAGNSGRFVLKCSHPTCRSSGRQAPLSSSATADVRMAALPRIRAQMGPKFWGESVARNPRISGSGSDKSRHYRRPRCWKGSAVPVPREPARRQRHVFRTPAGTDRSFYNEYDGRTNPRQF
ncbi:hypothetical protein SKAU_G00147540 [Synaphobranchus kaupii]|uniref:Uncharacterized protein n=1 Tax=Synaphobranchus kaupii TaxID=118154 RepID=A0A9Q1FTR5_SYNKA|nr:hypothetical protein SKAU_G00147540 [Synaphobranchus kaupii]